MPRGFAQGFEVLSDGDTFFRQIRIIGVFTSLHYVVKMGSEMG
jgi:hypothetical protein